MAFEQDPYPGQPRILFIGVPYSTHVHAWIDLLAKASFNVRLFGMQDGHPPFDWPVRTYVITPYPPEGLNAETRQCLYPTPEERGSGPAVPIRAKSPEHWLAEIIRRWQPDLIHTMGLEPAGEFYFGVRHAHDLIGAGRWIHWLWGGSDIELKRFDPRIAPRLRAFLEDCDQILSDNLANHQYLQDLGIGLEKIASISPVPGIGGVDVEHLVALWQGRPSQRRVIVWPKAYDSPWSVALPVLEALKLCWDQLQPCTVHMLSMTAEGTRMWYYALPEPIRTNSQVYERIPRADVLRLLAQSRVMLAPTLIDGFPNSVYEAMALGAFPIVSPLAPLTPVLRPEVNALFARNLYPEEIARALTRAMRDDVLVEAAAERNLALVRTLAERSQIRPKVIDYYLDQARLFRQSDAFYIRQRLTELYQREARLAQLAAVQAEREAHLSQQATEQAEHEARLSQQATEQAEHEARLSQQAAEQAEREAHLTQQAAELQTRESEVAGREARLNSRWAVRTTATVRRLLHLRPD